MILLATIVTLLFVGALDALNIFQTYQAIPDDNDDLADYKNSEAIADSYELLGLIILDYNPISRRDNDVAAQTNLTKDESGKYEDNGNGIEPRTKRRRKKKRHFDTNDNAKHKNERDKTLKMLGNKKVRIVEQKLIELIKEKLKKPNSEAKRKIEIFNEVQGRNKQNSEDKSSTSRYKNKEMNKLNNDEVKFNIHLDDSKKELSKESIIEKSVKKTERYSHNDNTETLRKQEKDKHKHFVVDTDVGESSEERHRKEKRKGKKQKNVETPAEVEMPSKPKRFDVVRKDHSNEFDRNVKLKKKRPQPKDGSEEEDGKAKHGGKNKNKNKCINETESNIDKCVRACQRTHEDVCDILNCSHKSLKALRSECSVSCKKVFPILCD